jgi:tetratricopeptide (TPR) repeat protein
MKQAIARQPASAKLCILSLCLALILGYPRSATANDATILQDNPAQSPNSSPGTKRGIVVGKKPKPEETDDSPHPTVKPVGAQNLALVIGVSKYRNLRQEMQLKYADKDARALAEFLVSPQGGFAEENVILLTDEQATREEIQNQLGKLRDSPKESLVLIYFAGHGEVVESRQPGAGQGFLLPHDAQLDSLDATAIQMDQFNNTVKNIRARSVVVIADACKSGTIGDLARRSRKPGGISQKNFAEADADYQSSFILTAAAPTQNSLELATLKHGVFTHYLLKGLKGLADRDQNGLVSAGELFGFVGPQVTQITLRMQSPESNSGFDPSIPLAILNERGAAEYRKWLESDPFVTRWLASFDEALRAGRLTRPDNLSAWFFYTRLAAYPGATVELIAKKRDDLQRELVRFGRATIDQSPRDPSEWNRAADGLEKAYDLQIDKDSRLRAWRHFCRGMAKHHEDEDRAATREFDQGLKLLEDERLNEPLIAAGIGRFYKQTKRLEDAVRAYQHAMTPNPQPLWRREFAETLLALERLSEAKMQLRWARKDQPDDALALKLLAEAIWRNPASKEELSEAAEAASRAYTLAPGNIEIEDIYGRVLLKTGQVTQAIPLLRKVANHYLGDDQSRDRKLLQLSRAYLQNADTGRAISALREAERRNSKSAEVYSLLGSLLEQQGEIDQAIGVARKAIEFAPDKPGERSERRRELANYYERAGRLRDAAAEYKNAANLASGDSRIRDALDNHALALSYRTGDRRAEVRGLAGAQSFVEPTAAIIAPGGRQAIERLTGVNIDLGNEDSALARVFDLCIRRPEIRARLISFFELYPEFTRRAERKGPLPGHLTLPRPDHTPVSEAARDALDFFGVTDQKGRRRINQKEFDSRKTVFLALGGDPVLLQRGDPVTLKWKNDPLPILFNLERWFTTKEGLKVRQGRYAHPGDLWLYFLNSEERMKLYVGASFLPAEVGRPFLEQVLLRTDEDWEVTDSLYFVAPYLRFTAQGQLIIPGGERIWQESLKKFDTTDKLLRSLLSRENGGLLYLFAALSAAGPAGDWIANSSYFKQLSRMLQKSHLPEVREPFDLMDLFSCLRMEKRDSLRLPASAELWLGGPAEGGALSALLGKIGNVAAGKQIPAVKQIAVLAEVERERPDWTANARLVDLIAKQAAANREALLELALDLDLSGEQLERLIARAAALDALTGATEKLAALRAFQSAFELLRLMNRSGALAQPQVSALTDRLLRLEPGGANYAFDLFSIVQTHLPGVAGGANGQEVENKLVALLCSSPPLVAPAAKTQTPALADGGKSSPVSEPGLLAFDIARGREESIKRALNSQRHTRFADLAQAIIALNALEANASDAAAVGALKAALNKFIAPEPPDEAKKRKSKEPAGTPSTLRETAASMIAPVQRDKLAELRRQIAPFAGEALLGMVYASLGEIAGDRLANNHDLVRNHDLSNNAWARAEFDAAGGAVRGSVTQLAFALLAPAARTKDAKKDDKDDDDAQTREGLMAAPFAAAVINAFHLVELRRASSRAMAHVAHMLDLGEELLALSAMRQPTAEIVLSAGLRELLTPQRAAAAQRLLYQGDVKQAIQRLTPSELYFLGRRLFEARRREASLASLANEPGALGALSRLLQAAETESDKPTASFDRELRQFGMPMTTRGGLARIDLRELDPYERALGFADAQRLAERMQDLKLGLARVCYRQTASALLPLAPGMARAILKNADREAREMTGGAPLAERDWQGLLSALGGASIERTLQGFLLELGRSPHWRPVQNPGWNDETTPEAKTR